jgi:hypothetical protein
LKKGIGINGIYGKSRRLKWIVVILIFSLISVSPIVTGNGKDKQQSSGTPLEQNTAADNSKANQENYKVTVSQTTST